MPLVSITTHSTPARHSHRPVVLVIGGSDSAGLAGVQMDVRCLHAMGVHAATAITAVTAQNNDGLYALNPVSVEQLEQQIDAALALEPQVIKIGLLGSRAQITLLAHKLAALKLPVVLDTVIATSSAGQVLDQAAQQALLKELLPLATVVTPNLEEARLLLQMAIEDDYSYRLAAAQFLAGGADWVAIKGGHRKAGPVEDFFAGPGHCFWLAQPRLATPHLRGTGCAFASLLAASLALGFDTRDAVVIARMAMQDGLHAARGINKQTGCVVPQGFPHGSWPVYREQGAGPPTSAFPACTGGDHTPTLGLYPIVDSAAWLERLLPLGISTAQLRIKHLTGNALAAEIENAVAIGRRYNCRLFINDHWQLAIDKGAYGVHLGQEDIDTADLAAIHRAGLRLGLSNHSHFELARALALRPSYIAVGPIFATTTKEMPWVPHGIDGLRYWAGALADYPLVAIAGIDASNIDAVAATGVSGVALITAITLAPDPEAVCRALIASLAAVSGAAA